MKHASKIFLGIVALACAFRSDGSVANEGSIVAFNERKPGSVSVANEGNFGAANLSEPLTGFALGVTPQEDVAGLLQFLAPQVPVGRLFNYRVGDKKKGFYVDSDDIRAPGAAFKRVHQDGTTAQNQTDSKGLTYSGEDGLEPDGWEENETAGLTTRIQRNDVYRAIQGLIQSATNTNKTWTSGTPDPLIDIANMLIAGVDAYGIRANRVIIGELAWWRLVEALRASSGKGGSFKITPAELATFLMVDEVRVVSTRYQVTKTTKAEMLGNKVISYFTLDGISRNDSSNIKRFISPSKNGGPIAVFRKEDAAWTDITVSHFSKIVITDATGVRSLTIS